MEAPILRKDDKPDHVEQIAALDRARELSNSFYRSACNLGVHAVIEHTGLINEHLKMLRRAADAGIDLLHANKHSGVQMPPMHDYEARYLAEKFMCMFAAFFDDRAWVHFVNACEEERRE